MCVDIKSCQSFNDAAVEGNPKNPSSTSGPQDKFYKKHLKENHDYC